MQNQARVETERALEASERGVERIIPGWTGAAVSFIHEYAKAHPSFTTEQVRSAAADKLPNPPDGRAWGPAVRKAVRLGYIQFSGYTTASDPAVHSNVVKVWRSRVGGAA